jgi:hypothetical protein
MTGITVEADIEVRCECGSLLSAEWKDAGYRHGPFLEIEPCASCKEEAHNEGFSEGEASVDA